MMGFVVQKTSGLFCVTLFIYVKAWVTFSDFSTLISQRADRSLQVAKILRITNFSLSLTYWSKRNVLRVMSNQTKNNCISGAASCWTIFCCIFYVSFGNQSNLDTRAVRYPVVVLLVVLALLRLALHLEAPLQDPRDDIVVAAATAADPTFRDVEKGSTFMIDFTQQRQHSVSQKVPASHVMGVMD